MSPPPVRSSSSLGCCRRLQPPLRPLSLPVRTPSLPSSLSLSPVCAIAFGRRLHPARRAPPPTVSPLVASDRRAGRRRSARPWPPGPFATPRLLVAVRLDALADLGRPRVALASPRVGALVALVGATSARPSVVATTCLPRGALTARACVDAIHHAPASHEPLTGGARLPALPNPPR